MITIKIGRSNGNDCVFSNDTVSGSHALLMLDDNKQRGILRDLQSRNGSFVNNKRVTTEMPVSMTDTLRFGSEITNISGILAQMNRTRVSSATPPSMQSRTIGSSPQSQIRLQHDDVSRNHAVIYKNAQGQIVIEDQHSTNGTYVNGVRITSQVLKTGDRVTITRNYPLQWESIFGELAPVAAVRQQPQQSRTALMAVAAVLLVALIGIGGYWWMSHRTWDSEKTYREYSSAVCWVYGQYGYRVMVDGDDVTGQLCQLFELSPSELVHVDDDELKAGPTAYQGTAFFITNDGKLATNLHITRPWLYDDAKEKLERFVNQWVSYMAINNPLLSRATVKVEGVMDAMCIIPDGLPISEGNAVKVSEVSDNDDTDIDVAIIQTEKRRLPSEVEAIIDIRNADTDESHIVEGRKIYTIGYPFGVSAAVGLTSNDELSNQIHSGHISQKRGEYEFGHDAETAGGASGSPIFNDRGQLIGIHHAGMTGPTGVQGMNRAIKAKYIVELLK